MHLLSLALTALGAVAAYAALPSCASTLNELVYLGTLLTDEQLTAAGVVDLMQYRLDRKRGRIYYRTPLPNTPSATTWYDLATGTWSSPSPMLAGQVLTSASVDNIASRDAKLALQYGGPVDVDDVGNVLTYEGNPDCNARYWTVDASSAVLSRLLPDSLVNPAQLPWAAGMSHTDTVFFDELWAQGYHDDPSGPPRQLPACYDARYGACTPSSLQPPPGLNGSSAASTQPETKESQTTEPTDAAAPNPAQAPATALCQAVDDNINGLRNLLCFDWSSVDAHNQPMPVRYEVPAPYAKQAWRWMSMNRFPGSVYASSSGQPGTPAVLYNWQFAHSGSPAAPTPIAGVVGATPSWADAYVSGLATSIRFGDTISGIAAVSDSVYVADGRTLRQVSLATGNMTTVLGDATNGNCAPAPDGPITDPFSTCIAPAWNLQSLLTPAGRMITFYQKGVGLRYIVSAIDCGPNAMCVPLAGGGATAPASVCQCQYGYNATDNGCVPL